MSDQDEREAMEAAANEYSPKHDTGVHNFPGANYIAHQGFKFGWQARANWRPESGPRFDEDAVRLRADKMLGAQSWLIPSLVEIARWQFERDVERIAELKMQLIAEKSMTQAFSDEADFQLREREKLKAELAALKAERDKVAGGKTDCAVCGRY